MVGSLDLAESGRSLNGKVQRFVAYSIHPPSCESPSNCRVSSKQTKKYFPFEPKRTETQSVLFVFRLVLWNKKYFFGLFLCFEPVSNRNKHKFWNKSKQTEKNSQRPYTTDAEQAYTLRCSTKSHIHMQHRFSYTKTQTRPGAVQKTQTGTQRYSTGFCIDRHVQVKHIHKLLQ